MTFLSPVSLFGVNFNSSIFLFCNTETKMTTKGKRIMYSEADCHSLVDIIVSRKNIIECKKTDAITWKQKIAAWEEIADIYNSSTTEPRSAEQLRCKYDNLKKEVRKYEAFKRQSLYQTGGGAAEPDIKASLKLLYAKIKSIIDFSVNGLTPSEGDSDVLVEKVDIEKCIRTESLEKNKLSNLEIVQINDPVITPEQVIIDTEMINDIPHQGPSKSEFLESENTIQKSEPVEIKNDWSDYTPKMLKSKKHKVLQLKRKAVEKDKVVFDNDEPNDRHAFKQKLMEEEAKRNEVYHTARMRREEELHIHKLKNILLQNEKLQLEIQLLKKQLQS